MAKIIGIRKSVGDYEGHPYSNYVFSLTEPYDLAAKDQFGESCKQVTGKTAVIDDWMSKNKLSPRDLLGKNANFYFDENKKVTLIQLA